LLIRVDEGLADLRRLADAPDATLCYKFLKAVARWRNLPWTVTSVSRAWLDS
jgi:hypothetical protein